MVEELMLIENPRRGFRGNPTYVAPYNYKRDGKHVMVPGYIRSSHRSQNPKGGKKMKNPLAVAGLQKEWFGGLNFMDMGAALGGLASSTMLPGLIIKDASTTGKKLLKAAVAILCAVGAGFVARNISPNAGKYAIAGGVAGALAQAIGMFTNIQIGRPNNFRAARISESRYEPPQGDSGVQVSVT